MNYLYQKASLEILEKIWAYNIADNYGDERWVVWREKMIADNIAGRALTFAVLCENEPVGEGTLILSSSCGAINGRTELCDNVSVANINALRIQKKHENKGHISKLIKTIEQYAVSIGYSRLTIGVEAKETRNLGIYLHWGYNEFAMSEIEDDDLVLYYSKTL